ncbi:MAG: hypothetical protein KGO92_04395 [Bacteroidota bacterium]|nr:hypothetical protein [Bacteroidota bacterium]
MARLILDIPMDKMQLLLKALTDLGIDVRPLHLQNRQASLSVRKKRLYRTLHKISSSFILFDWEFFSNELEYE